MSNLRSPLRSPPLAHQPLPPTRKNKLRLTLSARRKDGQYEIRMQHATEDMNAYANGAKRPGDFTGPESTKKRAPYASRACDACRRRKGRCSGGNPCTYCAARSLECGGAMGASDDRASDAIDGQLAAGL